MKTVQLWLNNEVILSIWMLLSWCWAPIFYIIRKINLCCKNSNANKGLHCVVILITGSTSFPPPWLVNGFSQLKDVGKRIISDLHLNASHLLLSYKRNVDLPFNQVLWKPQSFSYAVDQYVNPPSTKPIRTEHGEWTGNTDLSGDLDVRSWGDSFLFH